MKNGLLKNRLMKRNPLILLVIVAIAFVVVTWKPALFNNGKSDYSIVLCNEASTSEQTAAEELQQYLEQISGAVLPIISPDQLEKGQRHIFVGYNEEYGKELGIERPDNNYEGYTYRTVGKNIWIYGGKQRGTMYGVYSFLENELGIRWYTFDYTKIPQLKKWKIKELNHSEEPFLQYRHILYANIEPHNDWLAHNKCNAVWNAQNNKYGNLSAYWNAHTFEQFIPSREYFDKHPEYFSLREGKRTPYTQLCLSNPEVLEICIEKMKQAIADYPLCWVYSMSQSDNQLPCQCEKCRAIEVQYGGHSGLILWFVNQVADAIKPIYPDKYIGTFAYQYTRQAPKGITPRDNVVIRLCSIECCFAHPLEGCEHNRSFVTDIEDWSKIAPNLYIWDYVVNFRQYIAPFPNFGVLADNIKTFKKYNAIGVMEQAQYQSLGGEFAEMKSWVLSKLLWNPNLDTRMLVEQFINDYYGEAAQYIQQYFDLCHSLIKDDTVMGIYINEKNPLYTDEFVAEGKNILELAKQAVAKADDATRHRVDLVALQMDYLRLMRNPEETKSDGTYDRFCDFIRKHNIKANEPMPVEVFIDEYNKRVNR
jgi:hypothetical protein